MICGSYNYIIYEFINLNKLDNIKSQEIGNYISNIEKQENTEIKYIHVYLVPTYRENLYTLPEKIYYSSEIKMRNTFSVAALKARWAVTRNNKFLYWKQFNTKDN